MSEPRAKYSKQDVGSMYRSYLMREGPQNVGAIDWPGPKPGALEGLKFLSTGVFDTIERSTLIELIKGSGGRYYSSMSKNLDYLLVGREAGPAKLKDAETHNIKTMDEEEFFKFVCEKLDHTPKDIPFEPIAHEEPARFGWASEDPSIDEKPKEKAQQEKKSTAKKEKKETKGKEEKAAKKAKVTKKETAKASKETVSKRQVNVAKSASNAKAKKEPSAQSKGSSRARGSEKVESVKSKVKASSSSSISSKKSASESKVSVKKEKREQ